MKIESKKHGLVLQAPLIYVIIFIKIINLISNDDQQAQVYKYRPRFI